MKKSVKFTDNPNQNNNKKSLKNKENVENAKLIKLFRKQTLQNYSDFQTIYELYIQKQFKNIVKTIKLRSDKFGKFFLNEWKLLYIRIISLQNILDEKISKYYVTKEIPHFSNYIDDVNNDINNWIILIEELFSKNDKIFSWSFIDFIICFILKNCIILSKKYIHFGFFKDAITTLSLSLRLINQTKMNFSSPDSYFFASEIFLYLSSLMIAERNYDTAINLISLSVKFSYISLELRLSININNNQTLFDLNKYKNEKNIILKIFFNLSIAFYQLSICREYKNDSYNAFLAIQSSIFFGKFTNFKDCNLYQSLIKEIKSRLLMRNRILLFFENNTKKPQSNENNDNKINIKKRITYEERKKQKFENLKKYLEKLKIKEIDDDIPDLFYNIGDRQIKPRLIKITKQLKLLNYMMKDEFKDLILSMKKIEINNLDKETINMISKRILNLKNKEHFKLDNKITQQKNIKKKLENRKNSIIVEKDNEDDKDGKISYIFNRRKKIYNTNKSNFLKSTTALSLSTTTNKKNNKNQSGIYSSISKNTLISNNRTNLVNNIYFSNSYNKLNARKINLSMNSSPSAYISYQENNISNTKNKSNSHTFRSQNGNLRRSNSVNSILKFNNINKSKTRRYNIKNAKIINLKYSTPKYVHDKIFLNKAFRNKYLFLEKQFNKEIDFHKNLLKVKSINEELIRPKKPNIKKLKEKAKTFFYSKYYNELMNIKEKQIIFNKNNSVKKIRMKRNENSEQNPFRKLNLSNDSYLETEEIKKMNDKYINELTKNIREINVQKKRNEKEKKI